MIFSDVFVENKKMNTIIEITIFQDCGFAPDLSQKIFQIPTTQLEKFFFNEFKAMIDAEDEDYVNPESERYEVIKEGLKKILKSKKVFVRESESTVICYLIFNSNETIEFESSDFEYDEELEIESIFEF